MNQILFDERLYFVFCFLVVSFANEIAKSMTEMISIACSLPSKYSEIEDIAVTFVQWFTSKRTNARCVEFSETNIDNRLQLYHITHPDDNYSSSPVQMYTAFLYLGAEFINEFNRNDDIYIDQCSSSSSSSTHTKYGKSPHFKNHSNVCNKH